MITAVPVVTASGNVLTLALDPKQDYWKSLSKEILHVAVSGFQVLEFPGLCFSEHRFLSMILTKMFTQKKQETLRLFSYLITIFIIVHMRIVCVDFEMCPLTCRRHHDSVQVTDCLAVF